MLSAPQREGRLSSSPGDVRLAGRPATVPINMLHALITLPACFLLTAAAAAAASMHFAVCPCRWDHTVRLFGEQAIIVYPQSTGNPGTGNPSEGQGAKYRQVTLCRRGGGSWHNGGGGCHGSNGGGGHSTNGGGRGHSTWGEFHSTMGGGGSQHDGGAAAAAVRVTHTHIILVAITCCCIFNTFVWQC
jgi:hypothetical protein